MSESIVHAFFEIILPPGSTSTDLQTAVDNATSGDTIVISSDMTFTETVTIPTGKEITIQSDMGHNWLMSQPNTNTRHFTVTGTLILQNITLDGMHSSTVDGGGGVAVNNGNLTMNDGVAIQNCYTSLSMANGGGVFLNNNSKFTMAGGFIRGNIAGVYNGGGVGIHNSSTFIMSGGSISGNIANSTGGGVYIASSSTFTMSGGSISNNKAYSGGGIRVLYGNLEITGESCMINNNSANDNGGGIAIGSTLLSNLRTSSGTVFSCNIAAAAYAPPPDARTLYPEIEFASTTITDHPLNNFDIIYSQGDPITVAYNVSYDANEGIGNYTGPDILPGGTDTVLSPIETGIHRPDYTFTDWNTEPDGSGTRYIPGDSIILNCNEIVLYAQWVVAEKFTITYGANGGDGSFEDSGMQSGDNYTILSASQTGISRPRFTFTGWNTHPNGSGISYAPGDIITVTGDLMLYAQWRQNPAPPKKICSKPVTKCRTSIKGQKIWVDDDDIGGTRPDNIEILLLRDGDVYKRTIVDSENNWVFGFCCLPVWKNSENKYKYQVDEAVVPDGYMKTIEGYNIINTLIP